MRDCDLDVLPRLLVPEDRLLRRLQGLGRRAPLEAEFYEEYGGYRVRLTVPNGWTVMATGDLQNTEEFHTAQTRHRMAAALQADTMVWIATRADWDAGTVTELSETGALTYRFNAENIRDFTWTTSDTQLRPSIRSFHPLPPPPTPSLLPQSP